MTEFCMCWRGRWWNIFWRHRSLCSWYHIERMLYS